MRFSSDCHRTWAKILLCTFISTAFSGCSRSNYRIQADQDAYSAIAERNCDSRWFAAEYSIEQDPRSRYFDAYDPDKSPLPLDDPASHQYMHLVNGMKGWKHWHENGDRIDLENPVWRAALGEYADRGEDGSIKLDVDSALRIAYIHSPNHQRQLETLYLSALDVSAERFRLDTQFFGGYDVRYAHNGSLIPPQLSYSPLLNRFVITPPIDGPGVENNRLTVGRPSVANPALLTRRQLATAGELLVGFANSFVFEFTGGDTNLAGSLANFTFIQPLLRGAGRDVALEQLTLEERNLLANLRAYGQFRQGFYTQVAIGELGVTGPQRSGSSTSLQSFSGQGGVDGFLGLLQQFQQMRNSEDNLSLQERTLERLVALYDNELIDVVQVDQFEQSVESQRVEVIERTNNLQLALDNYKTGTLGLPSSLPVELDQSLISQFQLFPREANSILHSLLELQTRVGDVAELVDLLFKVIELRERIEVLPDALELDEVDRTLGDLLRLISAVSRRAETIQTDLEHLEAQSSASPSILTDEEIELVEFVKTELQAGIKPFKNQFNLSREKLLELIEGLSEENRDSITEELLVTFRQILRLSQGCLIIQAHSRNLNEEPEQILADADNVIEPVRDLFEYTRSELKRMEEVVPEREQSMSDQELATFRSDRELLYQTFADLEHNQDFGFEVLVATLRGLQGGLTENTRVETIRGMIVWVQSYLQIVERLSLIPAQARLETITVDKIELGPEQAFQVALVNRLDFMNGRAALVDRWRRMQVSADALQSVLNLTASGDIRTAKNNPLSFRAPTGSLRMGVEFDAPFTRLLERNTYRESLIDYQQNRRQFIQSRDSLEKGLRALLRTLEQRRQQLEIQRHAVSIAMRRVDQTQLSLNTPPGQLQPGARPPINPTTAINLLGAQSALQSTQNSFLAAWLSYYASRMRLHRELGIMELDSEGRWIEKPMDASVLNVPRQDEGGDEFMLPPLIPADYIDSENILSEESIPDFDLQAVEKSDDITSPPNSSEESEKTTEI